MRRGGSARLASGWERSPLLATWRATGLRDVAEACRPAAPALLQGSLASFFEVLCYQRRELFRLVRGLLFKGARYRAVEPWRRSLSSDP